MQIMTEDTKKDSIVLIADSGGHKDIKSLAPYSHNNEKIPPRNGSEDTLSYLTPPSSPRLKIASTVAVVTPDNSSEMSHEDRRELLESTLSPGIDDLFCVAKTGNPCGNVVTPENSPKNGKNIGSSNKEGHVELPDFVEVQDRTNEALTISTRDDLQNSLPSATVQPKNSSIWIVTWLMAQLVFSQQLLVLLFTEIPAPHVVVVEHNRSPLHHIESQSTMEERDVQEPDMALSKAERYILKGFLAIVVATELVGDIFIFLHCQTNNDSLNDWLWAIIFVRMMLIVVIFAPSCVDFLELPEQYDYLQYAYLGVLTRLVMDVALFVVEIVFISTAPGLYKPRYALIVVLLILDGCAVVRCLVVRYWQIEHYIFRLTSSFMLHILRLLFAVVIMADMYRNENNTDFIPGLCTGAMCFIIVLKFVFLKADKFKLLLAQLYLVSVYGLVYSCGFKQLCEFGRN